MDPVRLGSPLPNPLGEVGQEPKSIQFMGDGWNMDSASKKDMGQPDP